MSDNNDILGTSSGNFRLKADGLLLMLKWAGYGLIFFLALLLIGWVLVQISNLLPDASKEGWDPTPTSSLIQPHTEQMLG